MVPTKQRSGIVRLANGASQSEENGAMGVDPLPGFRMVGLPATPQQAVRAGPVATPGSERGLAASTPMAIQALAYLQETAALAAQKLALEGVGRLGGMVGFCKVVTVA